MRSKFCGALVGLIVIGFAGCGEPAPKPVRVEKSEVGDYTVTTLFTDQDGYTVKRFMDAGTYRYYVTPVGTVNSTHVIGKDNVVKDTIETAKPR